MTSVSLTERSSACTSLGQSDYFCCCFSVVSDTVSVGEAADLVELGSEPVEVTPLEPVGLRVEEVSGTFQA